MTLLLLIVALLALVVAVGAVAALISWHPHARDHGRSPIASCFDFCEVCGAPATHELGALSTSAEGRSLRVGGAGAGMVATYCGVDAPAEAVQVR